MRLERVIAMPNEILQDMKDWLSTGELKSVQHQEFVYSYYWLISYLWRYAVYSNQKITQPDIKRMLGYSSQDRRLNYIMRKDGLLDSKNYTLTTKNFPVSWSMRRREEPVFNMLYDINPEDRRLVLKIQSPNYFVKAPVKHIGDSGNDGIFINSPDTHMVNGEVFALCMNNEELGSAGLYLYGVLVFIKDKSRKSSFPCSHKTLRVYTGWGLSKIKKVLSALEEANIIKKSQSVKAKGSVNKYTLL